MMTSMYSKSSQRAIADYLKKGVGDGKTFFKAKHIARDLGLSPKEVGANLTVLSGESRDLKIEKWSYSKATTWHVVPICEG
jgi:hypothetical protein